MSQIKFTVKNPVRESLRRQHTEFLTVILALTLKSRVALMYLFIHPDVSMTCLCHFGLSPFSISLLSLFFSFLLTLLAKTSSNHAQAELAQQALHQERREARESLEIRCAVLEEEAADLGMTLMDTKARIAKERDRIRVADQHLAALDEEMHLFMQRIRERQHAVSCEKATYAVRIHAIEAEETKIHARVRTTEETLVSLRAQLHALSS